MIRICTMFPVSRICHGFGEIARLAFGQHRPVFKQYRRVAGLNAHACSAMECVVLSSTH
jgi:hypothetical protein